MAAFAPGQTSMSPANPRRLPEVLQHAARLFSEKGFAGASIRDLSRSTGISLAGLYHYFSSKEELLYKLQKHTFETVLESARRRLAAGGPRPEDRLRELVGNHLEYFLNHPEAMKVLAHEDEALGRDNGQPWAQEIATLKHEYFCLCREVVSDLLRNKDGDGNSRPAAAHVRVGAMSLFGMLNWVYTWHRAGRDPDANQLASYMSKLFLAGIRDAARPNGTKNLKHAQRRSR